MKRLPSRNHIFPVLLREEILELESSLLSSGIALQELIDRASSSVAGSIYRTIKPHARILVLAGRGNNGEDAVNAALKLTRLGYSCGFVFLDKDTFARNRERVLQRRVDFSLCLEETGLEECRKLILDYRPDVVLDGLFGIGFRRPLPEKAKALISIANSIRAFRVSVDVPSGVESDTAYADRGSFKADLTVTFFALKPAHVLPPSSLYCGKVKVVALGFEKTVQALNRKKEIFKIIPPKSEIHPYFRSPIAHKKKHAVLIIAGSRNMPGAAYLSAKAAFLAGASYVAVATERKAIDALSVLIPEAVFIEIDFENISSSLEILEERMLDFQAVLIGPGLSRETKNIELALEAIKTTARYEKRAVIDGDALFALSSSGMKMDLPTCILTPHEGEARRFVEGETDLLSSAFYIADLFKSVCVLKSSSTIIAGGKRAAVVSEGYQNLATAGSGDVLAGAMTAFLAYDSDLFNVAVLAVSAQAKASGFLAKSLEGASVLSSEIAESFRIVLKGLCGDENEG